MNDHPSPHGGSNRQAPNQSGAPAEAAWHYAIYQQLPLVFFAVDATGNIQSASSFGAEQLGHSPLTLTGQSLIDFIHTDDRVLFLERLTASVEPDSGTGSWNSRLRYRQNKWQWTKFTARRIVHEHQPLVVLGCEDAGAQSVAIAQQAELLQQVQRLRSLEKLTQEKTAQLQQALESEALLKRIIDRVRDTLDETQILQTAVRELALGLDAYSCDTGLYDLEQGTSTIAYEHIRATIPTALGWVFHLSDYTDTYTQLLQGQPLQFCWVRPSMTLRPLTGQCTILACPLIDDQGVIGDIWVHKPCDVYFEAAEIRLVQQVASQCAIAIRQARLYKAAQAQVRELEHLHQLKDDFLSTVSHELRSPMANIDMALQMLDILLQQAGVFENYERVTHYFTVLREECQREIELINNLLDLSRLEAGAEPVILTTIDLNVWLPHLAEPFLERIQQQQQQLQIILPDELPLLTTDLSSLERVVTELLHNACKYTPRGEQITITAQVAQPGEHQCECHSPDVARPYPLSDVHCLQASATTPTLILCICNSGVEIPADELPRIFDKFYRVSSHDPWKQGGTGLGLALVKRLIEHLGGMIWVTSRANQVTIAIELPLSSPE